MLALSNQHPAFHNQITFMILNALKANQEINRLNKAIVELTKDRDMQLNKLKEYEDTNKDYMSSAETFNQMKAKHKQETDLLNKQIADLKAVYEVSLAVTHKELDARVVNESIALVAAQGTNVIIDASSSTAVMSPEQAYQRLQNLTGEAKQKFYEQHASLFMTLLKQK